MLHLMHNCLPSVFWLGLRNWCWWQRRRYGLTQLHGRYGLNMWAGHTLNSRHTWTRRQADTTVPTDMTWFTTTKADYRLMGSTIILVLLPFKITQFHRCWPGSGYRLVQIRWLPAWLHKLPLLMTASCKQCHVSPFSNLFCFNQ